MIAPEPSVDWLAMDGPSRRSALGDLKAQLRRHPGDQLTRMELVRAYRALGNPDQSGRFALGTPDGPFKAELRAYASMLRGIGADESAARRLSSLDAEAELPSLIVDAIEGRTLAPEWREWGVVVGFAWAAQALLGLVALVVVYVTAMLGATDVQTIARWWTLLTGWALVVVLLLTTLWCATSSKWKSALVWGLITALLLGAVLIVSIALEG